MSITQRILSAAVMALTLSSSIVGGQGRSGGTPVRRPVLASDANADDTAAARRFVASFYRWYIPVANAKSHSPSYWRILTLRAGTPDGNLARALRADSSAQAQRNAPPTRDVIDFDPFLDSQDPCPRY